LTMPHLFNGLQRAAKSVHDLARNLVRNFGRADIIRA
jgi:hypothetical protein